MSEGDKDGDADVLPRFKGLPNIVEGVEDIHAHLKKRHVQTYPEDGTHKRWVNPQCMILFATGPIQKVVDIVVKNLHHPIGVGLVASILVQEPLRTKIIKMIEERMDLMDSRIANHPNFLHTCKIIDRLKCKTVHMQEYDPTDKQKLYGRMKPGSPIIALDFPQIYFGSIPSAIITLNTFRTINEAGRLCYREGLNFETVSIWTRKLTEGYDMVASLTKFPNFRFNCINAPFKTGQLVMVRNHYHYEAIYVNGDMKTIVFPTQTIFSCKLHNN